MLRTYEPASCIVFWKLRERYGGFSNFAPYPVKLLDTQFKTAESLFQALKHPDDEALQREIANLPPATAKKLARSKPARPDWDYVRVDAMRLTLACKFARHKVLQAELIATGDLPIVEYSQTDSYWGALPQADGKLVGQNVLGRLLMERRQKLRDKQPFVAAPGLKLLGQSCLRLPE